jgi:hypothetical protein
MQKHQKSIFLQKKTFVTASCRPSGTCFFVDCDQSRTTYVRLKRTRSTQCLSVHRQQVGNHACETKDSKNGRFPLKTNLMI